MVEQPIRKAANAPAGLNALQFIELPDISKGNPVSRKLISIKREAPVIQASPPLTTKTPLATWSSLISAKAMTSYFEGHHHIEPIDELKLMSLEDLTFLDQHQQEMYDLRFIAVYDRDPFSRQAHRTLSRLALQNKFGDSPPLTIVHCGLAKSKSGLKWRRLIREMSKNCQIKVDRCQTEFSVSRISRIVSAW